LAVANDNYILTSRRLGIRFPQHLLAQRVFLSLEFRMQELQATPKDLDFQTEGINFGSVLPLEAIDSLSSE